ncbi:unnamed protein product [Closterium sp. Naga37s-1]|nr:unnamed protein product [Closterium sp. Naga37s-1]
MPSSLPLLGSALHHLFSLLPASAEPSATGATPPLLFPPPDLSQARLPPGSPLPAPPRYSPLTDSPNEYWEPASGATSPVARPRRSHVRPPPVHSTHTMALRPSSVSHPVSLPLPPPSSLPAVLDPVSDLARADRLTVTHFLATLKTDPPFLFDFASALVAELTDFAATRRLDYLASLVSDSACPATVGGELALGCYVLEDRRFELELLATTAPHLAAMLLTHERDTDALDISTPLSYAEAITVKRPPGSSPAFKARYVARGFSQREWVDFFQTFSPTPKMTTLRVLLHVAAQRDYELHSPEFSTAFLQGSLH